MEHEKLHIRRHLLYTNHTEVSSEETWNMKTLHIRRHLLYVNHSEVSSGGNLHHENIADLMKMYGESF